MRAADVPEVARIERDSYEFPWSEGIFRDCLRVGYRCVVLEGDGGVLDGYAIVSIGAGEAHLLNLCVHPDRQGCGLGREMLAAMIDVARTAGARQIFLEVRPSNEVGIALYQSTGFKEIGRRPRYYRSSGGREDAVVLGRPL
ncbi:MAG: ribosomal protein S18-alanine N-acetyltransferase [Gammaproteobacteria bacterium]|nr:MAG: ribosomal protein S18-alanine N-acetyltransferase [Gammaproteobacteria bacterium]